MTIPVTPKHRRGASFLCFLSLAVALFALLANLTAFAQQGGEGGITGVVKDATGAVIANATVTATNVGTNVATSRTTSSAGNFNISPIPPGVYNITVTAAGFKTLQQTNITVNALASVGFNPTLELGEATETVQVTAAPPVLDTTNATVGLVMEQKTYANLPIQMNNAQRDATAFAALAPGAQNGTRVPIVGGTGNFLGQLYIDGMPAETINQQGDNRLVSQAIDLDAVDQFQVVTSTPPAEYSGAGSLNFTMKSGTNRYHGSVADFVRNTVFDAWGFTQKAATIKTATGGTAPAPKPAEHQNELSVTFGGKVPHTGDRLFFFFAYDKFHSRRGANPSLYTIPTPLMIGGDFTQLAQALQNKGVVTAGGLTGVGGDPSAGGTNPPLLYDPTSNSCAGNVCTRTPFQGIKNGVPTYNVIPTSYLSPIAQKMASFMPAPTNPTSLTNNFLGGYPSGFDNHVYDWRVDFDISEKQRISTIGAMGAVHYLNNYSNGLPLPYVAGTIANIFPKTYDVEDVYTISNSLVNQLKYGYVRFIQPQTAATDGKTQYAPAALGLTNLLPGQDITNFPGVQFGTTGAITTTTTNWTQGGAAASTQSVIPETYTLVDNLTWTKGKHSVLGGITLEWQQTNVAAPVGFTGLVEMPVNSYSTAQYTANASTLNPTSGNSFASFMLGAVGGQPSLALQQVSELGGRYHTISPYIEDNWKVSSRLTIDVGIRWDYFPPYHEVKNRWTFLNPNLTNPLTGTKGMLQFADNYGGAGVSCNCRTPVQTYWYNFGPRIGLIFNPDDKTVFRAGIARVFSQAGGVGGRVGAYQGTGQTGFNVTALGNQETTAGPNAGPSFYLNNGAQFTSKGLANTDWLGKGYKYPGAPTPSQASQELNTGDYLDANGKLVNPGGVSFADPIISGRAPEFTFWNAGIERAITKDMTLAVNYVGDQSHFLATGGNVRGYWANQLNPIYLAAFASVTDTTGKQPILIAPATSANVAKAQAVMPGLTVPQFYQTAANATNSSALSLAHGLVAFPQYSGVNDTWGSNSANLTYHSLQIMLLQRVAHGLTFNVNYTYSKNIGDDGTFRSGFDIPAAAISGHGKNWHQDRIERSWTTDSAPQVLHAFGVYDLPFGKGKIGSNSMLARSLVGGWQLSGIYTYNAGTPIAVTSNLCNASSYPGQGECMPDQTLGVTNARINGSYGTSPHGTTTKNLGSIAYVDAAAFSAPQSVTTAGIKQYLIGNSARTAPFHLRNPGTQDFDAAVHRTFTLPHELGNIMFEVDCINVWNKVTFNGPQAVYGNSNFGQITGVSGNPGPRDFQFAGHYNF